MAQTKPLSMDSLKIPVWFLAVAVLAIGLRIYWKTNQFNAPDTTQINWITPEELEKDKTLLLKSAKNLILYDFTAEWCPACKKRDRTAFKNPEVIKKINSTFIPVRVDLTKTGETQKPINKKLLDSYSVYSIPRCIITLRTGEKVDDDRYLYNKDFNHFLDDTLAQANVVRAEFLTADGKLEEALDSMRDVIPKISQNLNYINAPRFLLYHHLLCLLKRDNEANELIKSSLDNIAKTTKKENAKSEINSFQKNLIDYLQNKIDDKELLARHTDNSEKCSTTLAIGLKDLRDGNKAKARKDLQESALTNARNWRPNKLAELLLKKIED